LFISDSQCSFKWQVDIRYRENFIRFVTV